MKYIAIFVEALVNIVVVSFVLKLLLNLLKTHTVSTVYRKQTEANDLITFSSRQRSLHILCRIISETNHQQVHWRWNLVDQERIQTNQKEILESKWYYPKCSTDLLQISSFTSLLQNRFNLWYLDFINHLQYKDVECVVVWL